MQLQGDYNTNSASMVELRVEKCQGHDYCKNQTEIDEFFATDKYIVLLNNQIRFESKLYGEESIIRESVLSWMPLDTEGLFRQQYQLKTGLTNLQDKIVDLGSITVLETDIF